MHKEKKVVFTLWVDPTKGKKLLQNIDWIKWAVLHLAAHQDPTDLLYKKHEDEQDTLISLKKNSCKLCKEAEYSSQCITNGTCATLFIWATITTIKSALWGHIQPSGQSKQIQHV